MSLGITLIILAYNEEKNVKNSIINYYKQLKKSKLQFEIIVVNDGSTDSTLNIVKNFKKKQIKIINNKKNKGFALSLKLAIRKSKFNNFFWIGADNPNRNILKILKKFIQVGINNKNKFVIIQYYNELNKNKRTFVRRFFSNFYTILVNIFFFQNIPYYNGQSIYDKTCFVLKNLCNSRFILAQIYLESLKLKPKIYFVNYSLKKIDKDQTSENLLNLVRTTLKNLIAYRIITILMLLRSTIK